MLDLQDELSILYSILLVGNLIFILDWGNFILKRRLLFTYMYIIHITDPGNK